MKQQTYELIVFLNEPETIEQIEMIFLIIQNN